jgi:hypothetical protein
MTNKTENSVPLFDIPPAIEPGKMNPAGMDIPAVKQSYESAIKANEDLIGALEQRYAQPNWFKVAAGFAKPQLGGFLASLGSAAEAMGENVEEQRAIAPTIARMRAQIEASKVPMTQRAEQQRLFAEWQKTGDIKLAGQIYNLDPTSAAAQAVKAQIDAASTGVETSIAAQKASAEHPYMDLSNYLIGLQNGKLDETKNSLIDKISAMGYYTKDQLKNKGVSELMTLASAQDNQFYEKSLENSKTAADMVDNSTNVLGNLSVARQLAASPRLERLLGLESGSSAISTLFSWMSNGTDSNLSKLSVAARQLAEKDPAAYSDFQILRKSLATNLATAREGIQNPSVASQQLLQSTNPDVRMTKDAIIKLVDLQANQANEMLNRARLMASTTDAQGRRINPNTIQQSHEYQSITKDARARKEAILNNSFMKIRVPDFYSPYQVPVDDVETVVPGNREERTEPTPAAQTPKAKPPTAQTPKAKPPTAQTPAAKPPAAFTLEEIQARREQLRKKQLTGNQS